MSSVKFSLLGWCCVILILVGCRAADESKAPVTLSWRMGEQVSDSKFYTNSFVLKNVSNIPLGKDWAIYYCQLPRHIRQDSLSMIKIEQVNATFYKMYPGDTFETLLPGDSITVSFECDNKLEKISHAPEGTYWVSLSGAFEGKPLPVTLNVFPLPVCSGSRTGYQTACRVYDTNQLLIEQRELQPSDIIPSIKETKLMEGFVSLGSKVSLNYSNDFVNEGRLLKEKLNELYALEVVPDAPVTIELNYLPAGKYAVNDEFYRLDISGQSVNITSNTSHGIFNGTQTLLALLKGQKGALKLNAMSIQDYPDLSYRGYMLDIARNFTAVDDLKKLIDVLASYKLNVLHFHFSDDEGWRLEIPGLEELTTVGAYRGHTTDELTCMYPAYNGDYDPLGTTLGNGYYTRDEFIDLLRYAAERHVCVIPEIESPGHARAAIVAMKARYKKFAASDPKKANEYLLNDWQDTSRYVSAQAYTDNAMNVALPSTFRFMKKVIQEIRAMYKEAGVPLATIHLGGDEVPKGAWIGSPLCQKLMKERGMTKVHELSEYYISQMAEYLRQYDIPFSGWQEVALGHKEVTNRFLSEHAAGVYCWNTIPEWKGDEIAYQIANEGYPVILCNVNNFYMDLAYDAHWDEPGHFWAGYVDESKSFSMLPYRVYRSSRTNMAGEPVCLDTAEKGKTMLTASGKKQIKGVQAQLFSETIRGFQWVEYYMFPKIMGLVERGWNAYPAWGELSGEKEQQVFHHDLAHFYHKLSKKEMPYWNQTEMNFRLPYPGLYFKEGFLYANTSIQGGQIRYTTDGTEPTTDSKLWKAPVVCTSSVVKAKLFYLNKASVTTELWIK